MSALLTVFLMTPCDLALPLDIGRPAPCDGILVSADTAREALKNIEELKVRRAFSCPECPPCAACPEAPRTNVLNWTLGGVLAGAILGGGVILLTLIAG